MRTSIITFLLFLLNGNILFGQVRITDEEQYYELINSFIKERQKTLSDKFTVIDSAKLSDNHINSQYILTFQINQDKELRELINSDSIWIKLIMKRSNEREIKLRPAMFNLQRVNFTTNGEIKKYWDKDQHFKWKKFNRKFRTNGFMEFSTLKTLDDKGLIYYDIRRGLFSGAGFMVLLEIKNQQWTQVLTTRI